MCGAVVARMGMGTVLDILGPRLGNAITLLLFAPPVFCMSLAKTATDFTILRLFIGCSLCCFVCCEYGQQLMLPNLACTSICSTSSNARKPLPMSGAAPAHNVLRYSP